MRRARRSITVRVMNSVFRFDRIRGLHFLDLFVYLVFFMEFRRYADGS